MFRVFSFGFVLLAIACVADVSEAEPQLSDQAFSKEGGIAYLELRDEVADSPTAPDLLGRLDRAIETAASDYDRRQFRKLRLAVELRSPSLALSLSSLSNDFMSYLMANDGADGPVSDRFLGWVLGLSDTGTSATSPRLDGLTDAELRLAALVALVHGDTATARHLIGGIATLSELDYEILIAASSNEASGGLDWSARRRDAFLEACQAFGEQFSLGVEFGPGQYFPPGPRIRWLANPEVDWSQLDAQQPETCEVRFETDEIGLPKDISSTCQFGELARAGIEAVESSRYAAVLTPDGCVGAGPFVRQFDFRRDAGDVEP